MSSIIRQIPGGERVKTWLWRLLNALSRRSRRRTLQRLPLVPPAGAPVLNYGGVVENAGAILHGGRVKLRHLDERFPATSGNFNLLYLVSSALPRHAIDLVDWAKARGVKFVWNQNGVAYPAWRGGRCEEINGPMRELRARADFVFYQSEFCRACADRYLGEVSNRWEIAFNCVDPAHFQPEARPPGDRACRLLAAGSHHESYRIFSALETLAELAARGFSAELKIAGRLAWRDAEREVREKIRALALDGRVEVLGPYGQRDAPAIYRSADILLHAKYKDPCPTVPIEAMACGVPVVGSRSGGMPELVSREAGVLLEVPESWDANFCPAPSAVADAVVNIMSRWNEFSAGARAQAVARFSKEQWLAQHERIFRALVRA